MLSLLNRNPIDIFDKTLERFYALRNPIPKRRKISFNDYLQEIKSDYTSDINPQLIISIDDLSSLGRNKEELDMGGRENGDVVNSLEMLLKNNLKITAYTIPKPCFKKSSEKISDYFNRADYKLSREIIDWTLRDKLEIAQHGYRHIRTNKRGFARSMEFEWKESNNIKEEIIEGYKSILKNEIDIYGFKPPAWSVGQLNGKYELMNAIFNLHLFKYFSLSSPTNGLNYEKHSVSHIHTSKIKKEHKSIKNIPQNISILGSLKQNKELIKIICDKGGIVSIQSHACCDSKIISDGLSNEQCEVIIELSEYAISQGAKIVFAKEAI